MNIPVFPQFRALTMADLPLIQEWMNAYQPTVCELAPGNLMLWMAADQPEMTLINGDLCIRITSETTRRKFFLEPVGRHQNLDDTLFRCMENTGRLSRVSRRTVCQIQQNDLFHLHPQRNQFDYLYLRSALSEFAGRKFDGKRNNIKTFIKTYPAYRIEPLTPEFLPHAINIYQDWLRNKNDEHTDDLALQMQIKAFENAFTQFHALRIKGGALTIDNEYKGFMYGSPLNDNTFCMHTQYGRPDVRGLYNLLLRDTIRLLPPDYTFINLEQDIGIEGIRKSKLSYYPAHMMEKYEILKPDTCTEEAGDKCSSAREICSKYSL